MTWIIEERYLPIIQEIEKSPDRVKAIVAAAFLDEEIAARIKSRLHKEDDSVHRLFKGAGPLGGFAARIELAFLMGIYDKKTRNSLRAIADVRNIFAHKTQTITFNSKAVKEACVKLGGPYPILKINGDDSDARAHFMFTVKMVINLLILVGRGPRPAAPLYERAPLPDKSSPLQSPAARKKSS